MVYLYNQNKEGVDLPYQFIYSDACEQKSKSWPKKLYSTFLLVF